MDAKPFQFAMLSHPGRVRKGNEDCCGAVEEAGAFVVCDGMGGAAAGEVASRMATDAFLDALRPQKDGTPRTPTPDVRLDEAIYAANEKVYEYSRTAPDLRGMGTTLVALLLQSAPGPARPSLTLAHVGDSRCYLFREGKLTLLTFDHSLVHEQLRIGQLTAEEAENHPMRNIITRAVGSQPSVEPEIRHLDPQPGDLFLLASDGLTRELTDADILQTFVRAHTRNFGRKVNLHSLSQTLVDQANDAGGGDKHHGASAQAGVERFRTTARLRQGSLPSPVRHLLHCTSHAK